MSGEKSPRCWISRTSAQPWRPSAGSGRPEPVEGRSPSASASSTWKTSGFRAMPADYSRFDTSVNLILVLLYILRAAGKSSCALLDVLLWQTATAVFLVYVAGVAALPRGLS